MHGYVACTYMYVYSSTDMRCVQANVATRVQAFLLMCMSVHTCPHVCMHFIVDFSARDIHVTQVSHTCCFELVAKCNVCTCTVQ